jgi:hypothetical protein
MFHFYLQQKLIQNKLKSQKTEEENIQQEIDDYDKELKLFAAKKNTLITRIEECNENKSKLGSLPLQELTKYKNMGTKQVSMLSCFEILVINNFVIYLEELCYWCYYNRSITFLIDFNLMQTYFLWYYLVLFLVYFLVRWLWNKLFHLSS